MNQTFSARRNRAAAGVALAGGLLLLLTGCVGEQTLRFQLDQVINAPNENDLSRNRLSVDVLCLGPKELEKHPEIVNGSLPSSEWFRLRDSNDAKVSDISAARVLSLREATSSSRADTRLRDPLASVIDSKIATVDVKFKHPEAGQSKSALIIYPRFASMEGIAATAPLVLQPAPRDKEIVIRVGRQALSR
ncbi:MAG: hypothetical protein SF069_10820 [Phycisphaerae bacterium]|nr:hypothetical protein [Phycisphaerae bacterium]